MCGRQEVRKWVRIEKNVKRSTEQGKKREREREIEREKKRKRKRERERDSKREGINKSSREVRRDERILFYFIRMKNSLYLRSARSVNSSHSCICHLYSAQSLESC